MNKAKKPRNVSWEYGNSVRLGLMADEIMDKNKGKQVPGLVETLDKPEPLPVKKPQKKAVEALEPKLQSNTL